MAEIFDALRRDGDSSNTVIGIVILVLMTVFVAPDVLPQLVSESIPFVEEGLPCNSVMRAQDRATHQSLIGRQATDAISLNVEVGALPTDGTRPLVIRVIVINETIGTVPVVFNPNQVIIGNDTNSSGIGLIFTPPFNGTLDHDRNGVANQRIQGQTIFPTQDIIVLGPRQRCVHRVEIPSGQLAGINAASQVRAYYRITTPGTLAQTNIYPNQGLNAVSGGFVESQDQPIPFVASANAG